jgi:hypothetical protein
MKPKYKGFSSNTDITFCSLETCRVKGTCHRHTSNYEFGNDEVISVFHPADLMDGGYGCSHYWEVE